MTAYRPPFEHTPAIVMSLASIERLLGRFDGLSRPAPTPRLRRTMAVRTVQATLAIEGETLDEEQVTAVLEGKRVRGTAVELLAAKNAIAAYERAATLRPDRESDFLSAHATMMQGLIPDAGRYRRGNVGVLAGTRVAHVAPQPKRVPSLVGDLLGFVRRDRTIHPVIKSAIVHYEIEFIHPFSDGNGRMGRLWQHLLLVGFDSAFAYVPVETAVRQHQSAYYAALAASDRSGEITAFAEFSLEMVRAALESLLVELRPRRPTADERLALAREHFGRRVFSRQDYVAVVAPISGATASRDLAAGIADGVLARSGDKATARYRFTSRRR